MERNTTFNTNIHNEILPEDTSHAAVIHLSSFASYLAVPFGSVLGPLITWLIWRKQSTFSDAHGKEALNFNLSILLYQILAVIIGLFLFLTPVLTSLANENDNLSYIIFSIPGLWIFISGFGLLQLFRIIAIIVAAVKASNGEYFTYPLSIRFIK